MAQKLSGKAILPFLSFGSERELTWVILCSKAFLGGEKCETLENICICWRSNEHIVSIEPIFAVNSRRTRAQRRSSNWMMIRALQHFLLGFVHSEKNSRADDWSLWEHRLMIIDSQRQQWHYHVVSVFLSYSSIHDQWQSAFSSTVRRVWQNKVGVYICQFSGRGQKNIKSWSLKASYA